MDASPLPSSPNAGCGRGSHGRERHRGDAPPRDIPTPPGDAHADRHAQPGHPTHHVIRSTHDRFPPPGHVQPTSHRRRRHRGRVQGCPAGNHATSHHVRPHGPPGNRVHAFRTRRPVHQRRQVGSAKIRQATRARQGALRLHPLPRQQPAQGGGARVTRDGIGGV